MELFQDNEKLTFDKLGMEARMSEEPNDWPEQIIDLLYKQAPYASDYSPKVVLDEIDPDRRYAMGRVELVNQLAINPRDDSTPSELRGKQKVLIPIIIKDGKLSPLDLLMHSGEVEPLTEDRLRAALFRPSLFEAIRKRPGDMSLIEQLYPPNRQYGGARGPLVADVGAGGMARTASARPEYLLDAILPTVKKAHIVKTAQRLGNDPSLRNALLSNDAVLPFMAKLADAESIERDPDGYLKKIAHSIPPNVIQVKKIEGGFRIKTAQSEALVPTSDDVDRPTAVGALGGDLVSAVERDGTTTISTMSAKKETLEDLVITTVSEFGLYKVKRLGDNKEMVGWVFPKVMDFTGEVLPIAVFSNGSQSAMQENIAGVPLGRQPDVLDSPPQGMGCFYYATSSGAMGLVPVMVKGEAETPEGVSYVCETIMGERCGVIKVPGLKAVREIEEGRYGIPESCGFLPMDSPTELVSSPDEFIKQAEAVAAAGNAVRIITDGICYSFEGPAIDKLAGVVPTQFLDRDDSVFLGSVLGQEPTKLAHKLDNMRSQGSQELWIDAVPATPMRDKYAAAKDQAREYLDKLPDLRADLLKEAAPLEDPAAVDKILSVGFLNPENVSIFASYEPEIEATIKKLSELLMASRMGLGSVEEGALQKAIVHLDKVVAGLKTIGAVPQA